MMRPNSPRLTSSHHSSSGTSDTAESEGALVAVALPKLHAEPGSGRRCFSLCAKPCLDAGIVGGGRSMPFREADAGISRTCPGHEIGAGGAGAGPGDMPGEGLSRCKPCIANDCGSSANAMRLVLAVAGRDTSSAASAACLASALDARLASRRAWRARTTAGALLSAQSAAHVTAIGRQRT